MITVFFEPDGEVLKSKALVYLGYFFLLAGGAFVGVLTRSSVFNYLGERLTRKLRAASFSAALRQPAAFFDSPENSVGRLTTRLATDAALVKGASGDSVGSAIEGLAAVAAALAVAFSNSWRLALVLLVAFPLLAIGSMFEFRGVAQLSKGGNEALERASDALSEAVAAARTVAAFGLQARFSGAYSAALGAPYAAGVKRGLTAAGGGAFQRFVLMATYSVAFYAGAQFISRGLLQFEQLIQTFLAITLAAEAVGRITSQAPDVAKASAAAGAILALIDAGAASPIDPLAVPTAGARTQPPKVGAALRLEFRDVTFAYPSRPAAPVLSRFSLVVEAGSCVGVVGASGSGKSTLGHLLFRLYDVDEGAVLVDGTDVRQWDVRALRRCLGLVQQEPALFADSVGYNVAYGGEEKMAPCLGAQPRDSGDAVQNKEGAAAGSGSAWPLRARCCARPRASCWTRPPQR
jgi:ABC-type multidrug transport system fused ATPase/permease subunit